MNEDDRELLMLLGSAGKRVGEIVTGLFEDNLTRDEQIAFGHELVDLAERFRQRALRTSGMVVEGIVVDDHDEDASGSTDYTSSPGHK